MKYKNFEGLTLLETKTHFDARGHFRETYRDSRFAEQVGRPCVFVQDNEAFSQPANVLRGFHFQKNPKCQAKLIRVTRGAIFDAVVDLRRASSSYGRWRGFELSADNGLSLFVPEGFAHGYLTLEENTVVTYKASNYYAPETEGGLIWNDPAVGVEWPLSGTPLISEKDLSWPKLSELGDLF